MTKRKVSTKTRGTKDKPVDAEIRRAAERAGIKPRQADPWQLTGAAFDGEESLRHDTTAADLFKLCFESGHPSMLDADSLLEAALFNACDHLEIIEAELASENNLGDALRRFALRAEYQLKVAHEVHRRLRAAEQDEQAAEGGAS